MKKNNIKLYIFIIMNILILFLNSFVYSILDKYNLIILLVVDIFIFYKLIGFEQHRFRYTKDIILDMFIFIMIFFLLYYILGLAIGFLRIENYFTIDGLKRYIFPTIIIVILKEILRYMVVIKLTKNNILKISVLILFLLFDVSTIIYYYNANNVITVFKLLALYIMPSISSNIMCMRLTSKVGYKPLIFYLLIMNTYYYIIPIIPNPSEYLSSIIQFILPLLLLVKLNKYVILEDDEYITDDRKINTIPALAISMILVIAMSYLVSGYFYYEAIAIASGSMSPNISKGDVVIVEKDTTNLKVGTVIAYKHDNIIIVHRLVNIVSDGETNYYYTKGDSNNMVDNYPILIDDIIGKVDVKIPYVGIPTVWLNSLF